MRGDCASFRGRKRVPFPGPVKKETKSHETRPLQSFLSSGVGGGRGRRFRLGRFQFRNALAQRPSTERHVRELGRYLDGVKIAEPLAYRQLAVYPVLVDNVPLLRGRWLTADAAISAGVLVVTEKPGGNVPLVQVENRSREEYVFLMAGEVISGGMQTRTVRHEVVLAPGQKIDLDVFCVEHSRWSGGTISAAAARPCSPSRSTANFAEGPTRRRCGRRSPATTGP